MMHPFEIPPSWQKALEHEMQKPYLLALKAFVEEERVFGEKPIYPPKELVFNAFFETPYEKVKVVIVGQDPYHGVGQAHGLCFSVPQGVLPPPSLKNIFKELGSDLSLQEPNHGSLLSWAKQGVFLLNALLTVRQGEPLSHQKKGWERFTDAVIHALTLREEPIVFLLWGKYAQDKFKNSNSSKKNKHTIFEAAHPSPLSCHNGFFGCKHFSKANEFLIKNGKNPINWSVI